MTGSGGTRRDDLRADRWRIRRIPTSLIGIVSDRTSKAGKSFFEIYKPILCGPKPPTVRDERLLMDAGGVVKIYYAPFEYINPNARIVLVGITPGPTQMVNANNEARRALQAGKSNSEAIKAAKDVGGFQWRAASKQLSQTAQPLGCSQVARVKRLQWSVLNGARPCAGHLPPAVSGFRQ